MAEETDARFERLEKASQDQQGQLAEITELLKTLVRDKAQAAVQQNNATQPEQKREDPAYPPGFTPHTRKCIPCLKWVDSHMGMHLLQCKHMKWDRTLGQTRLTR